MAGHRFGWDEGYAAGLLQGVRLAVATEEGREQAREMIERLEQHPEHRTADEVGHAGWRRYEEGRRGDAGKLVCLCSLCLMKQSSRQHHAS